MASQLAIIFLVSGETGAPPVHPNSVPRIAGCPILARPLRKSQP